MRSSTKLKNILFNNTITISLNDDLEFELIVVDDQTGDAQLCRGKNFSQAVERAYRDVRKAARKEVVFAANEPNSA